MIIKCLTVNPEIFARILFSRIALKTYLRRQKFATRAWCTNISKRQSDYAISRGFYFHETSHIPSRKFPNLHYLRIQYNSCARLKPVSPRSPDEHYTTEQQRKSGRLLSFCSDEHVQLAPKKTSWYDCWFCLGHKASLKHTLLLSGQTHLHNCLRQEFSERIHSI